HVLPANIPAKRHSVSRIQQIREGRQPQPRGVPAERYQEIGLVALLHDVAAERHVDVALAVRAQDWKRGLDDQREGVVHEQIIANCDVGRPVDIRRAEADRSDANAHADRYPQVVAYFIVPDFGRDLRCGGEVERLHDARDRKTHHGNGEDARNATAQETIVGDMVDARAGEAYITRAGASPEVVLLDDCAGGAEIDRLAES